MTVMVKLSSNSKFYLYSFALSDEDCKENASGAHNMSLPGPSSRQTEQENLAQLMDMFPEKSRDDLLQALNLHGTINKTALSLSTATLHKVYDSSDDDSMLQPTFAPTLASLLKELERNKSQEKEKLKVDEDAILNDAMSYYKHPDFDPKEESSNTIHSQPAVDTGVLHRTALSHL